MGNDDHRTGSGPSKGRKITPIGGVLDRVMGRLGLATQVHGWQAVSRWSEIVGEQIAAKSQAIRYADGVLYVAVKDAVWRQELSMRSGEIMNLLRQHRFGHAVKQVRLVMGEKRKSTHGD